MAFPTYGSRLSRSSQYWNGMPFSAGYPSGVVAGDLVLLLVQVREAAAVPDTPAGFTSLGGINGFIRFYYRVATSSLSGNFSITTGDETGSNITATTIRIIGADSIALSSAVLHNSTTPNSPNLSHPWASNAEVLWLAIFGGMRGENAYSASAYPANYSGGFIEQSGGWMFGMFGYAQRQLVAASEDPGAYTLNQSIYGYSWTLALRQSNATPTAPTNLARSNKTLSPTVSWTFNDPDSGDSQSAYQVVVERWTGSAWTAQSDSGKITSSATSRALSGLAWGTQYRFRVRTYDQADAVSPYSADFAWWTNYAPNAPTGVAVSNKTLSPTVSWTFSDPDVGDTQTAYQVVVERWTGSAWTAQSDSGKITSVTASRALSGLAWGTQYRVRVRTYDNLDVVGAYSTDLVWTTNSAPNAPTNLASSNKTLTPTLSWTFSDVDAGDTQSAYQLVIESYNGSSWVAHSDTGKVTSTVSSRAISSGLSWSTQYRFKVKTWDALNVEGPYSGTFAWTTNHAPTAPINLANSNKSQAPTLTWTFTDPDAGDTQSAYQLILERYDGASWVAHTDTGKVTSTVSSRAVSGLLWGTQYRFRVKTWDALNVEGAYSSNFSWTTNFIPNAPINLARNNRTLSPTVSWTFSDPDAGDTQSAYQVIVERYNGTDWVAESDSGKITSATASRALSGLAYDTQYRFRVRTWDALNAEGPYSANFEWATNYVPLAPTSLAVSDDGGYPTLSWAFNDPDVGDTQTAYQILCERWNGSAWVTHFTTSKATSATSSHVVTTAQRFSGREQYRFSVTTWDNFDSQGPYSAAHAWFTTLDAYELTGSYVTEAINVDRGDNFVRNGTITWTQNVPADTALAVSVRSSADGVSWGGWTVITSGASSPPANFIQLKFDMTTTYNLIAPTFSGIGLSYPAELQPTHVVDSPVLNIMAAVVEAYTGQATLNNTLPSGTAVLIQYRGSQDGVVWGSWVTVANPITFYPYIQYRYTLTPNADRTLTPTVNSIATSFLTKYNSQGSLITLPISLRNYVLTSATPSWSSALNSGTISVEAAVAGHALTWGPWFPVTSLQDLSDKNFYVKFRITLGPSATGQYTPTMSSMSVAAIASDLRGYWQSPVLDVSNATSQDSGIASPIQSTPGASRALLYSRSSPDQQTWTPWVSATAQGELQHPAGDYAEILMQFDPDNDGERPSVWQLAVSFDGEASVDLLSDQFSPGGQFHFAQLLDYATITNGLDVPQKYDGDVMTELGGDPPRGFFVAAHKNRLWMLRGSRLYFTDLIDIEEWPILNFIDISPNDGDEGTALYPSGDYLIIAKKHSIWLLVGDSYDTFSVRRLSAARGCIAPRSITMMDEVLVFVSDDGIYFSDFAQTVLASERLRKTWDTLNHRRLNQAVSWFAKQKLYVSLPSAGQPTNDTVLVYDALRKAWYVMSAWQVSCATSWIEAGQQVWLVGHSNEGQVSQIDVGRNNNGQPIEGLWESRYFDARMPEIVKRFRQVEIMVTPAVQPVTLEVQFCQDGGAYTAPVTMIVPGRHDRRTEILQLDPARSGIFYGRSIGMRIRQATMDAGVGIVAINLSFYPLQERPTIRS